jgi:prepilin-type processing-associated H-X9-DG protein
VKNEQIFTCPSDSASNSRYMYQGNIPAGQTSLNYGSYGMNGAYGSGPDNTTPPRSSTLYLVRLASVQAPATTVWVTDNNNAPSAANPGGSQGFFWGMLPAINTSATPHQLQNIVARHFDFTDVLFCDGHVKAMKLEVLRRSNEAGIASAFTIEDD